MGRRRDARAPCLARPAARGARRRCWSLTVREGDASMPSVARILGSIAALPVVRQLAARAADAGRGRPPRRRRPTSTSTSSTGSRPATRSTSSEVLGETGDAARIPLSVLDAVRARVALLDERGRRALQAAAILGVRSEPWLLAAIAGEDLIGIDDSLARRAPGQVRRDRVPPRADPDGGPRGPAGHPRDRAPSAGAGDALERAGDGDAARLAYHAEGAADRGGGPPARAPRPASERWRWAP